MNLRFSLNFFDDVGRRRRSALCEWRADKKRTPASISFVEYALRTQGTRHEVLITFFSTTADASRYKKKACLLLGNINILILRTQHRVLKV